MNTERFFEAMAFKLSLDQKRLDDELERNVNLDLNLDDKLYQVETTLQKMVNLEAVVNKFNEMVKSTNNNNKDAKQHQE